MSTFGFQNKSIISKNQLKDMKLKEGDDATTNIYTDRDLTPVSNKLGITQPLSNSSMNKL